MELIHTYAGLFEAIIQKSIPHNKNDIIGIQRKIEEVKLIKNLSPGKSVIEYTKNHLAGQDLNYVIMDSNYNPKYSVGIILPIYDSIRLPLDIQDVLRDAVFYDDRELSGMINRDGTMSRLLYGSGIEAPYQDKSTPNRISFHTHPLFLYDTYETNIGWPSEKDVETTIEDKHLVISYEGIYFMNSGKRKCNPPSKKGKTVTNHMLQNVLNKCNWILLPWGKDYTIYF